MAPYGFAYPGFYGSIQWESSQFTWNLPIDGILAVYLRAVAPGSQLIADLEIAALLPGRYPTRRGTDLTLKSSHYRNSQSFPQFVEEVRGRLSGP